MISPEGRHLEFGKGDIGIHMGETSDVALLVFRSFEQPAPIGHMIGGNKAKEIELLNTDVVMSFSNTESIDALVKCLMTVKRKMHTSKLILVAGPSSRLIRARAASHLIPSAIRLLEWRFGVQSCEQELTLAFCIRSLRIINS